MKIDKYDRQVRIWGTKGQQKLTFAKVAILGCSGASI
jgi:molybdopterin/thiamine biosynthesis adenylyltransferase